MAGEPYEVRKKWDRGSRVVRAESAEAAAAAFVREEWDRRGRRIEPAADVLVRPFLGGLAELGRDWVAFRVESSLSLAVTGVRRA